MAGDAVHGVPSPGGGGIDGWRRLRVAVCIATCERPDWLRELLLSVAKQTFRGEVGIDPLIVVVDNDADGSARTVAEAATAWLSWPLAFSIEPRRGISFARNRAVAVALAAGVDLVAFVDDDELVGERWLGELVRVLLRHGADVVSGPVLPRYESGVPGWVVGGRFFERPRYATGAAIEHAATNNTLICARLLARFERPFEESLALTAGHDTLLFMRARAGGARMVWADDAVVEDRVSAVRATAGWILRRAYSHGNAIVWCERELACDRRWVLPRTAKAFARIIHGALLLLPAAFFGRAAVVRACASIARGAGALMALLGARYLEYRPRSPAANPARGKREATPERSSGSDASVPAGTRGE